jgi:polyisoprenyl-phosphate glycosyltransferase
MSQADTIFALSESSLAQTPRAPIASSQHAPALPVACTISLVVPALNEAKNLPVLWERVKDALGNRPDFEIIIVDDGSTDDTMAVLRRMAADDCRVRYLSFSRNFGHQRALRAGLERACGDCIISMDADLQHPPALLSDMLALWREDYQVVSTIRLDRTDLNWFKRLSSRVYYRLVNALGGLQLEPGSADFRLLDRKVVDALRAHGEVNPFYRGLVPGLGFRCAKLSYLPGQRLHGQAGYTLRKMISLALDGVISTTTRPLRLATVLAGVMSVITGIYAVYALSIYFYFNLALPGWTSVILVVSLIGSLQLLVLGIIGEYLGRVLNEVRRRPAYIVQETNIFEAGEERSSSKAGAAVR